ncbi:MAG: biopolymer transport protein ExbB [Chthoniobacter sp.]|jgi:biopolymer transport protein ExbB|nr:biopolymer transport protein ExbB [Chthoniobacter sp.]
MFIRNVLQTLVCTAFVAIASIAIAQPPAGTLNATPPPAAAPPPSARSPGAAGTPEGGPSKVHKMSWGDKLKESGKVGVIQFAVSAFGAIFIFERFFGLRRKNIVPPGLTVRARKLWQEGKFDELERLGESEPSTLARVVSFIAQNRQAPMAEVGDIAGDLVSRELEVHHQRAYPLGIVSTLQPLLGLLGMIFGMITTFETVAMAGALGDPTQLAQGISEALVTTGLGLAFAIPFLALYHYFKYKTNGYGVQIEGEVTSLLTAWFMRSEKR